MASYTPHSTDLIKRLRRIEGQIRGLQRMIEEERYCVEVLTQIASAMAATRKVGGIILEDHIKGCVSDALSSKNGQDEAIAELLDVVERFSR